MTSNFKPPERRPKTKTASPEQSAKLQEKAAKRARAMPEGGNGKPDQAWINEVWDDLHEPDESTRPDFEESPIQYQWTGLNEDLNPDFFEAYRKSRNGQRCKGISYVRDHAGMYVVDAEWDRLRRPCLSPAMKGGDVCYKHGGSIPHVRQAAQRRLGMSADTVAKRLLELTKDNGITDDKVRLGAIKEVLDRAGIKSTAEVDVRVTGFNKVVGELFGEEAPEDE